MNRFKNETGAALVTTLVIILIISTTVIILLNFIVLHKRLIIQEENFLQAKHSAESGMNIGMTKSELNFGRNDLPLHFSNRIEITKKDSVDLEQSLWGGYLYMKSRSEIKESHYTLSALVGTLPDSGFDPAIVLNPQYSSLVVTGNARIHGDVRTGKQGVKKGTLAGRPYTGSQIVFGQVEASQDDRRPGINKEIIQNLLDRFNNVLNYSNPIDFDELIQKDKNILSMDSDSSEKIIYVTNKQLNKKNWQISGKVDLISNQPLRIISAPSMSGFVRILSSKSIVIDGNGIFENVILYSSDKVVINNVKSFSGQIFSEKGITINGRMDLEYPSLLLVDSQSDFANIELLNGAVLNGSVIMLSGNSIVQQRRLNNILIDRNSRVNGLVYSDNFVTLDGEVNGTIITDRFYFYLSPTTYFNWIKDGIVNRKILSKKFVLPIFFKTGNPKLKPVYYQ